MNWRERWYEERGLAYEPPKLGDCPPFRCIGRADVDALYRRITGGEMGPRTRQPGEDDE